MSRSLPQPHYRVGLGFSDFARHYFRNHYCFLFLRVLRCFSSPGSPHTPIYSVHDNTMLLVLSSLIRISADQWIFAPPRSFSQLVTSFFGAMYQGILRKPFVAWSSLYLLVSYKKFYFFHSANSFLIHSFKGFRLNRPFVLCLLTKLALLFLSMKNFAFCTRLYYFHNKNLVLF